MHLKKRGEETTGYIVQYTILPMQCSSCHKKKKKTNSTVQAYQKIKIKKIGREFLTFFLHYPTLTDFWKAPTVSECARTSAKSHARGSSRIHLARLSTCLPVSFFHTSAWSCPWKRLPDRENNMYRE